MALNGRDGKGGRGELRMMSRVEVAEKAEAGGRACQGGCVAHCGVVSAWVYEKHMEKGEN